MAGRDRGGREPDVGGGETLTGTVERTRYHDPNTRYTVLVARVEGSLELLTLVGRSDGIEEGAEFEAVGAWTDHPKHGRQFQFDRLRIAEPTTPAGIMRRLMLYPGVRETIAKRIIARFGDQTLDILDKQPRRLKEVEGVGDKTLERMLEYHQTRVGPVADLENVLLELDLPVRLAVPIHRCYREQALEMLREHPYRLARDVSGIGFQTADRIARAMGADLEGQERIEAGLLHAMEMAQGDGHCALPMDRLLDGAARILDLAAQRLQDGVYSLVEEQALVGEQLDDGTVLLFPADIRDAEDLISLTLADLALQAREPWTVGDLPDHLSAGQRAAVEAIARVGVVVLTGGPGTGKSTVVRQVLDMAEANDEDLLLAAPTGRAAKRLSEATGRPAKTVHRLLEIQGESGDFAYNAHTPLPPGLVVIDESSMLDVFLAEALLSALTPEHRLMLVGDADQLPSVGPGNVLRDVLNAASDDEVPIEVVTLTEIFRQAEGSSIVLNAHRILAGESLSPDPAGEKGSFFVIRARDAERSAEVIVKMAAERIPEVYGLDPVSDVQILCPMHRGRAGTDALNRALQTQYTEEAEALELTGGNGPPRVFRVGDRVMQIRNDYERGVFNGDIGTVSSVDPREKGLTVEVDGAQVAYDTKELAALRLAYAVTIHKSQGSEFPAVLIPLLPEHSVMLRRNLLYTAVTRAKELCVIVGDTRAIERAIRRSDAAQRFTGLGLRVRAAIDERLGTLRVETGPVPS